MEEIYKHLTLFFKVTVMREKKLVTFSDKFIVLKKRIAAILLLSSKKKITGSRSV